MTSHLKTMTVEIHGTGTHNRGAELMACSAASALRERFPDIRIVVPINFGSAFERCNYNFYTTYEFGGRLQRKIVPLICRFLPQKFREKLGLIDPKEIDLVLDASGFAFSDQWGVGPAFRLLKKMNGSARVGKPLVLLPQAFGGFEEPSVREAAKELFKRSSFLFTRDDSSEQHVREICPDCDSLRSPDFTLGLKSLAWDGPEMPKKYTLLVPNYRMLDKGSSGEDYLKLVERSYELLESNGQNPHFLLHDNSEDKKVLNRMSGDFKVLTHHDPQVLKGILGSANFVLGSRFHALVGALSQGVPCVGLGWSHKYPELFADFGVPEFCASDLSDFVTFENMVIRLSDEEVRSEVSSRIQSHSVSLKAQNAEMWERVFELIEKISSGHKT